MTRVYPTGPEVLVPEQSRLNFRIVRVHAQDETP